MEGSAKESTGTEPISSGHLRKCGPWNSSKIIHDETQAYFRPTDSRNVRSLITLQE